MTTSNNGIDLIQRFEGFRSEAYRCPAGKLTIGYGHVIGKNETIPAPLSRSQASELLKADLTVRENIISNLLAVDVTQNQFDALISFVYNVGISAFSNSTLLKLLNKSDYIGAAREFTKWTKATVNGRKVTLAGLVKRRAAERELFERN